MEAQTATEIPEQEGELDLEAIIKSAAQKQPVSNVAVQASNKEQVEGEPVEGEPIEEKQAEGELVSVSFKEDEGSDDPVEEFDNPDEVAALEYEDEAKESSSAPEKSFEQMINELSEGKYRSWDEVKNDLSKEKEPAFEDDFSKSVYENIRTGKLNEVADVLNTKLLANNIEKADDETVLRKMLEMQYPSWTEQDIEDELTDMLPEFDEDDPASVRKYNRELKKKASEGRSFIKERAKDIKLPELERGILGDTKIREETSEKMAKEIEEFAKEYKKSLAEAAKEFDGYEFNVSDDNIMDINARFTLKNEEKSAFINEMEHFNIDKFFENNYTREGKYNTKSLLRDMWILKRDDKGVSNFEKIVSSLIKQAATEVKSAFEKRLNGGGSPEVAGKPSNATSAENEELKRYMELTS